MNAAWRGGLVLALLGSFLAGFSTGRLSGGARRHNPPDHEIRSGPQGYTNPLLECEIANEKLRAPFANFGSRLNQLVDSLERDGQVRSVAVYFRDLNNGAWIGHHEQEQFVPASLAKVPIVIACFRQAEDDPAFLEKKIIYDGPGEEFAPGALSPEPHLTRGKPYSVEELIRQVTEYSDNLAALLLAKALSSGLVEQVYSDLGIAPERLAAGDFHLSPKEYGAFFRVLYNASYLSKRSSSRALEYFDRSTFELGLVAGVPQGLAVAHKFGVWTNPSPGDKPPLELHDCGIIYHPHKPYLLCVMTAGENYVRMASAIAKISRFAYAEVDALAEHHAPTTGRP